MIVNQVRLGQMADVAGATCQQHGTRRRFSATTGDHPAPARGCRSPRSLREDSLHTASEARTAHNSMRTKTIGDYLLTLAPWIAYALITDFSDSWSAGFAVGLTISAGTVIWRTIHRDSRFIDVGTLSYCAVMTAVSLTYPDSPLRPYNIALSSGVVGALSLISIVISPPFTYRIARDKVPDWVLRDAAKQAMLLRAHITATKSWTVAQTAAGALGSVFIAAGLAPVAIAAQLIGTLVPAGFTRFQHDRFMRSAVASANSTVTPEDPAGARGDGVCEHHVVAESDKGSPESQSVYDRQARLSTEVPLSLTPMHAPDSHPA